MHIGRSFLRSRRLEGHNVAMLYLDLTEAFYRILRPLVVGGEVADELIMHVGARLGLSTDLLAELHQHLDAPSALARAQLPQHLQNAVRALHEDTHFHVRGQVDTCRTRLGSRPGDCFADVIFAYLWGRILHSLQDTLQEMGLAEFIVKERALCVAAQDTEVIGEGQQFLGPTWMDDTCVCACLIYVLREWSARSRRPQVLCWLYVNLMDFHPTFNQASQRCFWFFRAKGPGSARSDSLDRSPTGT